MTTKKAPMPKSERARVISVAKMAKFARAAPTRQCPLPPEAIAEILAILEANPDASWDELEAIADAMDAQKAEAKARAATGRPKYDA